MKFLLFVAVSLLLIPMFADAQSYRTHSVSASGEIFSIDIPVVGTIRAIMEYDLDFEVIKPNKIQAGKSDQISLSPKRGVLTTSFYHNGDFIDSISKDLSLGSTSTMNIPGTVVGQVFGTPTLFVLPQVSGPASMSISDTVEINTMTTQRFTINTSSNIGNSDSISVSFPMAIAINFGGKINLYITDYTIVEDRIGVEIKPVISEKISLEKFVNTNMSIDVKDGTKVGYAKVFPKVTDSSGRNISSNSISLYVDGVYKSKISSNQWSQDIYSKSGTHNFKAEFPQTTSSSNKAIIYKQSTDVTSFTVKSPPKQTSSPTTSSLAKNTGLTCGEGTHEDNGQCVADEMFGGGCLIATATYGSELAPQVQQLREIRDNKLLQTKSGNAFMEPFNDFYYSFSPHIADYERENPIFKEMVRMAITPMISSLSILNYVSMDSESEVLWYGISLILLNIGMYVGIPASMIIGIRKIIQ
jgi:hypothetical protein